MNTLQARLRANALPYCGYALMLHLLFVSVYGSANWLASRRDTTLRLYFDWELAIPFVPAFIVPYVSLHVLFLAPMLALEHRELKPFAQVFALQTLVAGAVFLLAPMQLGFPRPDSVPGFEFLYSALYQVDLPHNPAPSLHIGYGTLTALACMRRKLPWLRALLAGWLLLIMVSVVLTYQHHLIDVVTGFALGALCYRAYLRRIALRPVIPG